MTRPTFVLAGAVASAVFVLSGMAPVIGQAPPASAPPRGAVVGTGTFTGFVDNMDRSLAFYHDAFGMDVPALPPGGERPYNPPNPRLFDMFDIQGAKERHQSARVAGTPVAVELMEIQNVEHHVIPLRLQDPGTATLVLEVRDVGRALVQALDAFATVVTPAGTPVPIAGGGRSILIRDRDSRPIELRQAATPDSGAQGNILDMRLAITVNDLDATTRVYRDVLGFTVADETGWRQDATMRALTGLASAEVRRNRVQAPGSRLWIEFVEYRRVDRQPHTMRIQDHGAARLQLRAQNVDALVDAMTRAGLRVMSTGGTAVPIPPNLKGALIADPNNFFLTPFAPCDGCAPTLGR